MFRVLFLILSVILGMGCRESGGGYLVKSSGNINNVSIVMDQSYWDGDLGESVRDSLQVPYIGLPWDEPQFTLHYIVPEAFTGFARQNRNVVRFAYDTVPRFHIAKDQYASPQLFGVVTGRNARELQYMFDSNVEQLRLMIVENERLEKIRRINQSPNRRTDLQNRFGIKLTYPTAYSTLKDTTNFIWIQKPIVKGHMNIVAYELPIGALDGPTRVRIPEIRDSIGSLFIPGRLEGSHMITEKAYLPYYSTTTLAEMPGYLTKGMWEVDGDFMAGPFVNYMLKDTINRRWLVLEGFTFAPASSKRENMFELSSILSTLAVVD